MLFARIAAVGRYTWAGIIFYGIEGIMGKASRGKRDRHGKGGVVEVRALPVLPASAVGQLGGWDGEAGDGTAAGVATLRDCDVPAHLVAAYAATGITPDATTVGGSAPEELLAWGAAVHGGETANWDEFITSRPELADLLTSHPAADTVDSPAKTLVDFSWALTVGWPTSTAAGIVDVIERDDDTEISALTSAAALAVANLKNAGVFTNAVTQASISFGKDFNLGDTVRSYLGVANFEPAVIRIHEENSAAAMLAVHSAILAGALSAGAVTAQDIVDAAEPQGS